MIGQVCRRGDITDLSNVLIRKLYPPQMPVEKSRSYYSGDEGLFFYF